MDSEINQTMVHPQGPGSRQYFINDLADMGDYFHVGICTDIFLSKIGSFASAVPEGSKQMYDLSEL